MADNSWRLNKSLSLNPQSSVPTNPVNGDVYYDSAKNSFVQYNDGFWINLASQADVASATTLDSAQFTATVVQNSFVRITGSTTSNLYGLTASAAAKQVIIYNESSASITVHSNDGTEPTSVNRILTPNDNPVVISPRASAVFTYDASQTRWTIGLPPLNFSGLTPGQVMVATSSTTIDSSPTVAAPTTFSSTLTVGSLAGGGTVPLFADNTGTLITGASAYTPPTVQSFTSTGTTTGYLFTISTISTCSPGDTYTNNSNTYTVLNSLSAQNGQVLFMSGASAPTASGTLTRTSGAGTASISFSSHVPLATYTTPVDALYLKVRLVGGGGGGTGGGSNGGIGGTTAFGSSFLIATGGDASQGGTASFGVGASGFATTGGSAGAGNHIGASFGSFNGVLPGGIGAASPFGGAGGPGQYNGTANGQPAADAVANTGSGGGGGSTGGASGTLAAGGGAGGYIDVIIGSPAATYVYTIGAGGAQGTGGGPTGHGGTGGSGFIIVEEFYQ